MRSKSGPTSDHVVSTNSSADAPGLDGRVNRLAAERSALFRKAGATLGGLSNPEHVRLKAIERELDDRFALRRQQRVAGDVSPVLSIRVTSQRVSGTCPRSGDMGQACAR